MTRVPRTDVLQPYEPSRVAPWDRAAATALLRRTALAHPPAWIERCLELGPRESVRWLLRGDAPDAREREVLARRRAVLALENPAAIAAWVFARMATTRHPLRARMLLFWHDHFATSIRKVKSPFYMAEQIDSFEKHGLGRFGDLLRAVAKGPAMLRWLDAESNRKGSANENFARELFELFALGRGAYTERDIAEAARAFTGWRIVRDAFFADPRRHDRGEKTVFGKTAAFDGDALIDLTLEHDACGRFLAGKLLAAFVGPGYPEAARDELARVLRDNDGRIDVALERLLASALFHEPKRRGTRVRGPIEWMLWMMRTLEVTVAPLACHDAATRMGQSLLDPPDVSGWKEERSWITSATWLERANFAGRVAAPDGALRMRPRLAERVRARGPARELRFLRERLFPEGLDEASARAVEAQVRAESRVDRDLRLAGCLRALVLSPAAQRF